MSNRWRWVVFGLAVGALYVVERLRPLRPQQEPGPARVGRNLVIGLLAGATTAASEWPVVAPVQRLAERRRLGLLRWLAAPRALRVVLGFLLLDYSLYLWHRLNHRMPFLWRFHAVHHIDLDLDSTTGLRFHFGELALAAGFRAAQVLQDAPRVAADARRIRDVPPQQPRTADRLRAAARAVARDPANAWHPSFQASEGHGLELFEPLVVVGSAPSKSEAERAAGVAHDWRSGIFEGGGRHARGVPDAAFPA